MSVFEGKLDEIREISIDRFLGPHNVGSTAYFLTHCHTDHMVGLDTAEFNEALMNRDNVYLYTSEISRCILKNDRKYKHLAGKVKSISTNRSSLLTIPSLTDSDASREVTVTLLPAGHCPGSVMFLFELEEGNVLYTGDFRVSVGGIQRFPELHYSDGTPKEIDVCYLDATFFDESYLRFPSREESLRKICTLIKEWLDISPEHEIMLDKSARYGYEHIYVGVKEKLGVKIHVEDDIYFKYRNVREIGSAITVDSGDTRIHACGLRTYGGLPCRKPNVNLKTIRLSCQWYKREYLIKGEIAEDCPCYTRVCYACHCSYSELVDFLMHLSPKKTVACAVSEGRSSEEVEKEIADLLKSVIRKRKGNYDSYDDSDPISIALKGQAKRKIMRTPRKRRPFIKVSEGISSDDSWSKSSISEKMCNAVSEIPVDAEPSISETPQTTQKCECNSSSLLGSDNELSPSMLPQYSTEVIDPAAWICSSGCYLVEEGRTEKEIEIITLSSDESPEIFAMD